MQTVRNMDQIIGVSHKYYRKVHSNNAKKHWFVYFYDAFGLFRVKRCTRFQALWYKTRIKKGVTGICPTCLKKFTVYDKNTICPFCK